MMTLQPRICMLDVGGIISSPSVRVQKFVDQVLLLLGNVFHA